MSVRFARVSADFAESSRWVWAVLGFRAWEPKGVSYLIRLVDGSVGGTARMRAPRARDGAGEAIPRMRDRIADLLAREPFVLLVLALDALVVTFRLPDFVASDTWLALVSGRDVSRGWIPRHETLTVWSHGRTWVDQQWLGQLSMYGVHAAGGLRLLLLVHGAMLAGAFALALAFARRSGGSSRSVALVGIVAFFVALPNSAVRTQVFAYPLFVLVFWLLASQARSPSRRVLLVVPLLVLWANIHGSAVLGAGLVILWAFAEIVRAGRRAVFWRFRLRAAAFAAAAPLCLLVSPYGLALPGYYHDVLGSGAFRDIVSEWHATTFPEQWPFFVLALGALWLVARKPRRLSLFEHLALVATLVASFDAIRNIAWFALVALMVAPRALDELWPTGEAPLRRRVNLSLSLGALAVCVGAFGVATARPAGWVGRNYPAQAAVDAVAVAAKHDPALLVFSNERYADWLLWKLPSLRGRVAFDARFELLTSDQLQAISRFRNQSSAHWIASADGYRLLVLDPRDEEPAVSAVLREPGTKQLYRDRRIAVLLRSSDR